MSPGWFVQFIGSLMFVACPLESSRNIKVVESEEDRDADQSDLGGERYRRECWLEIMRLETNRTWYPFLRRFSNRSTPTPEK